MEKSRMENIEELIADYRNNKAVSLDGKKEIFIDLMGLPINTKLDSIERVIDLSIKDRLSD